jgi:hypothetical protein
VIEPETPFRNVDAGHVRNTMTTVGDYRVLYEMGAGVVTIVRVDKVR